MVTLTLDKSNALPLTVVRFYVQWRFVYRAWIVTCCRVTIFCRHVVVFCNQWHVHFRSVSSYFRLAISFDLRWSAGCRGGGGGGGLLGLQLVV